MTGPTMLDVAREAGVSRSAVSNYFNRPDLVSTSAAERIQTAIAHLGFVPNGAARALRSGQSRSLGMLLTDPFNPFFAEFARGAERVAEERGWNLVIMSTSSDRRREARISQFMITSRVDGVIVYADGRQDPDLSEFVRHGISPVVVGGETSQGIASIGTDDREGGRLVGAHFADIGRTRVGFIGDLSVPAVNKRHGGLREALQSRGLPLPHVVQTSGMSIQAGVEAANDMILHEWTPIDAIFAATDQLAFGVLQSLLQARRRVPEDVALVGYDDVPFSRQLVVPLTAVHVPALEMGERSVQMLFRQFDEPSTEVEHSMLDLSLVVRESTAGR